jgi:uncharacterized membrane protein
LNAKEIQQATQTTQVTESHWYGPLPPPAALQQFDAVVPDGAERIFKMAELEQAHRIELEKASLELDIESQKSQSSAFRRGHYLGAIISGLSVFAAAYTAHIGAHWAVSVALVGVPLMGVVRAIVLRRN